MNLCVLVFEFLGESGNNNAVSARLLLFKLSFVLFSQLGFIVFLDELVVGLVECSQSSNILFKLHL